jgi:hypothetical protein
MRHDAGTGPRPRPHHAAAHARRLWVHARYGYKTLPDFGFGVVVKGGAPTGAAPAGGAGGK